MENKQMADYILTIKADGGYESTTEGRCTAEQYGQAITALHGEAPQRKPMTDDELDLMCEKALFCRISFQQFARSIEAAHGIKE